MATGKLLCAGFSNRYYLTGIGQKEFIAELMPKYPIYVSLLSKAAQQVIGKVHEQTRPALALLESEGFACRGYVDIFDAGPTVEARVEQVRTVRDSKRLQVRIGEVGGGEPCLISNTSLVGFRACWAELNLMAEHDYIIIPPAVATALNVSADDWVRVSKI